MELVLLQLTPYLPKAALSAAKFTEPPCAHARRSKWQSGAGSDARADNEATKPGWYLHSLYKRSPKEALYTRNARSRQLLLPFFGGDGASTFSAFFLVETERGLPTLVVECLPLKKERVVSRGALKLSIQRMLMFRHSAHYLILILILITRTKTQRQQNRAASNPLRDSDGEWCVLQHRVEPRRRGETHGSHAAGASSHW